MSRYPLVALGEVLNPTGDSVAVEPTDVYQMAGVYSFGRGLFRKMAVSGSETSYKAFNPLRTDRFVYSRLFAWEGALAVVPPEFDGFFVSTEFPTFDINGERAVPEYLSFICRWPQLHQQLARATTGLGLRRQRVYEEALLRVEIPLPPVDDQRRIATYLNSLLRRVMELSNTVAGSAAVAPVVVEAARTRALGELEHLTSRVTLDEVAEIAMGQSPPGETYNYAGEGLPLLNGPTDFGPENPIPRQWTTQPTAIARVGDLLMSVRASIGRMNWADREYCIGRGLAAIRVTDKASARFLRHVILARASEIMAMTAGSTFANLPGAKLRKLPVPLPPLNVQQSTANFLDDVESKLSKVHQLRSRSEAMLKVFPASVLNAAFAGTR